MPSATPPRTSVETVAKAAAEIAGSTAERFDELETAHILLKAGAGRTPGGELHYISYPRTNAAMSMTINSPNMVPIMFVR